MVIPTHEPNRYGLIRTEYRPETCEINKKYTLRMTWSTQWGLTYSPPKILSVIPYLKKQCNSNPFSFSKLYFSENIEILEPLILWWFSYIYNFFYPKISYSFLLLSSSSFFLFRVLMLSVLQLILPRMVLTLTWYFD